VRKVFLSLLAMVCLINAQDITALRNAYVAQGYGLFFCFNLVSWQNKELGDTAFAATRFNPSSLDAGKWADVAVRAKVKYAVLTAKHHDGFCLWPSAYTTYDVASSPWKSGAGDFVKEFCDSMRSRNISPIIYFSIVDTKKGAGNDTTYMKNQITELLANYGSIAGLWLDAWGWSMGYVTVPYKTIHDHIKSLQPNCLVLENNHLYTLDSTDIAIWEKQVDGDKPAANTFPGEVTETIRSDAAWFWKPAGYTNVRTYNYVSAAMKLANSRNATYLIAVQPDTFGLVPNNQDTVLINTANTNLYTLLQDSLSASTTLTPGVYNIITAAVNTKNYPLYFDCRIGNIVIQPALGSTFTFLHTGTAVCSTLTGKGKLIFTSVNDTSESAVHITGSTGLPDTSNVVYPFIYSTGTGGVYLSNVKCKYNYNIRGALSYNRAADALTKDFVADKVELKNIVLPNSGGINPMIGAYASDALKINKVHITNCFIDTSNHASCPGSGMILSSGPANDVLISGNYIVGSTVGTGVAAMLRTQHISSNATLKNNLIVGSSKCPVGYLPIMQSGACTTWIYNNIFYGPNKSSGSIGTFLYGVSASGNISYTNDNIYTGWENGTNIRNHSVVRFKEVFYNNTSNSSAGAGNTVGTAAFTTQDPTFTTLSGKYRRNITCPIPDGWVIGNAAIKKHGSRTATDIGIPVATSTFDGSKIGVSDTVTAGIWYLAFKKSSGGFFFFQGSK
jgi:hypothetical protein